MQPIYLIKDYGNFKRKIMLDMAWLSSHKEIRIPKYYYEDGLYLPFKSNHSTNVDRYFLTRDKIFKEDQHHFYFKFPFKAEEVEAAVNS